MSAPKGDLPAVPARYKTFPCKISDVSSEVREHFPISGSSVLLETGQTQTTFEIPNVSAHLYLGKTTINGDIQMAFTSTSTSDTWSAVQIGCPNLITAISSIEFFCNGTRMFEQYSAQYLNALMWNLKTNSLEDLQIQPYSAAPWISGSTGPSFKSFTLNLNYRDNMFGGCPNMLKNWDMSTPQLIPLYIMPKITVVITWSNTNTFVSTYPGYTPVGTLSTQTTLQNLHMELYLVSSKSLMNYIQQNGWSSCFQSYAALTSTIPPTPALNELSLQIPSSYASLSHVLGNFQRQGDLINLALPNRCFVGSPEIDNCGSVNVRRNSDETMSETGGCGLVRVQ